VGQRLKTERERKGIPYVEVARATGVYIHHLAALEFGRYDEWTDDAGVDASVHAYATYLGMDGAAAVADLRRERGLPDVAAGFRPAPVRARRSLPSRWVAAPVLVALLAVAAWWAMRPGTAPEPEPAPAPPPSTPAATIVPPPIREEPSVDPEPGPVAGALAVPEHGVGREVRDNRLVGAGDRFEEGSVVRFWTLVTGGAPGDTVRHVWSREGREVQTIVLRLGAARWRTHSAKTLLAGSAGSWTVEARDESGAVLATDRFVCTP
jgi:transcriptional regulator with XRE-family HTH domain